MDDNATHSYISVPSFIMRITHVKEVSSRFETFCQDSPIHLCYSSGVLCWVQIFILQLAQLSRTRARFKGRIRQRIMVRMQRKIWFLSKDTMKSSGYRLRKNTIRWRIGFGIQQNTLEEQHKWLGEWGQDILLEHPH